MNTRRQLVLVAGLGVLAAPLVGLAQLPGRVWHIGCLIASSRDSQAQLINAFTQGLLELGYREGRNLSIEYRFADDVFERLPAQAAELVTLKVDVIFAPVTPAALAAKKATQEIPIVFAVAADPVGTGLVPSLGRPNGNVTGLSSLNAELAPKRLELLLQAVPNAGRVAALAHPDNQPDQLWLKLLADAAQRLRVKFKPVFARSGAELDAAFATLRRERVGGLLVIPNFVVLSNRRRVVELARNAKIPAIFWEAQEVRSGGLISYGISYPDQFRRAALIVDKILRGAKPADLPVEQPTRFELVINLKTAKALGLKIPLAMLLRADEVIR